MTPTPKTLEDFLGDAYALSHGLRDGSIEALAQEVVASGLTTQALTEMRDQLRQVEGRCVVSLTGRAFLDRVLSGRELA